MSPSLPGGDVASAIGASPSRFLPVALGADDRARERAEAWRRLHRRPDAAPPTPQRALQGPRRSHVVRAVMAAFALLGLRRRPVRVARDG
jgi:hypothetical protein